MRQKPQIFMYSMRGAVILALLLAAPAPALEVPPEPFDEVQLFQAAGAIGTLFLPAGAPDRHTPAMAILPDAPGLEGRAGLDVDRLLGAGFAVLDLAVAGPDLRLALATLAEHPRILLGHLRLLGMVPGGPGPVAAPFGAEAATIPAAQMQGRAMTGLSAPGR